jgi:uncharacterized protein YbaP (TraB family)
MTARIARFFALAALLACWPVAQAAIHKCLDAHNKVFYQDKPCQELTTANLPPHLEGPGAPSQRQFLWKATSLSTKGEAYLLGSLHFGSKEMYPLPPKITDAFNVAEVLVVEADLQNAQASEAVKKLMAEAVYPEGVSLEEHVKPGTWRKLMSVAQKLNIPEAKLRQQQPWLAALTITTESLAKSGFDPAMGIDRAFVKDAGAKKPILQLESAEAQIKLLQALTGLEQEQWLLQALLDADKGPALFQEVADAWRKGDAESMDMIVRRSFDSSPTAAKLFQLFFTDRNAAMAKKIEEMTADGRKYFFVVGAGHLGGDQGIVKLLEEKGFRIEQP